MRKSVSAIFICGDEVLLMKRQNHLRAFPGYTSFPGGKVDKGESLEFALYREIKEELDIDIKTDENIESVTQFALAITPDFNPHRFENYYYKVFIKNKDELQMNLEEGEIEWAKWFNSHDAFKAYELGKLLVVPPMISILQDLSRDINSRTQIDPNLKYDSTLEVPMIEPLAGLRQYMPLSNTFPPANRTNCFVLGDDKKVLIDPSPKNVVEKQKLLHSISEHNISEIFLTHHHPDHHEFCVDIAKVLNVPICMSKETHEELLAWMDDDNYFRDIEIKYYKSGDILTTSQGHDVELLMTSGHARGQMSLLRKDRAWMIVSDLIQTVGTVTVGGPGASMKKYFDSLNKVISIDPQVVMPSHGIGLGGTNKIKETLKHRLMREEVIAKGLANGDSIEDLFNAIYPELPERLKKYALLTITAHVDKINDFGVGE